MSKFQVWPLIIATFISSGLAGMSTEQQAIPYVNAGDLGKLPQELVQSIASFCQPADRCALRCTGKYPNTILQCFKQQDEDFLAVKRKLRHPGFRNAIIRYFQNIRIGTEVIGALAACADLVVPVIILLDSANQLIFNKKFPYMPSNEFSLAFFAAQMALLKAPFCSGFCSLLLRRPASYFNSLAVYLYYRKQFAKEAPRCFATREEYRDAPILFREYFLQRMQVERDAAKIQGHEHLENDTSWRGTILRGCHYLGNFINPPQQVVTCRNLERASVWLHSTILNALPSRRDLPVEHNV